MTDVESVKIQPIDKSTINKICSGQVVLNLATAVKELVENSIDAGATSIQIKLVEYGSEVVEVIDNGCGVEETNFQALTLKHHTSKITEFSDLYNVETFGFRGEALSSLCSLSDVTIITQHRNANVGAILKFNHNGIITSNTKTQRKTGTTVRLENLFSTLPIRRTEFIRNLKREFGKMCNVLYAYGLQSSGVRILCTNNFSKSKVYSKETQSEPTKRSTNTTIMDIKGDSVESNIISIFGVKQKQSLLKFTQVPPSQETLRDFGLENKKLDCNKFQLSGFISSCSHGSGRASSDRQFYYVNSRPMDNVKISKLINEIYHQYNNRQDPFVVLDIKVACGSFDMNLTPDKRQILVQDEKLLLATIKESLHALFRNIPSTLQMQNLGLMEKITVPSENVSLQDKLQKFRANTKNILTKNQEVVSTQPAIDSLPKFRLETKSNHDFLKIENPPEPKHYSEELKNESQNNQTQDKPLLPEITEEKLETPNNLNSLPSNSKTIIEILTPENLEECQPHEIKSLERANEMKRKLNENIVKDNSEVNTKREDEETELKRIKLDSGLAEEDKSNRIEISYNISFSEIQRLSSENHKNNETNFKNSDVKFLAGITPQSNERAENELKKEITKESFKKMEIIGQFNLGFIIAKLGSDIFIIDQHASDEKYNFETLQATTVMQIQKLFNPEKLELSVDKEELILQHRDVLKKNGFEFSFDENEVPTKRVSLTAIPYSKNVLFGKEDVDELLFLLENAPELKNLRPSRVESMFASRACRKSVMIGTALSSQEMKKIVDHMGEIEQPWNCPHGRPTMRHLVNLSMVNMES